MIRAILNIIGGILGAILGIVGFGALAVLVIAGVAVLLFAPVFIIVGLGIAAMHAWAWFGVVIPLLPY